MVRDGVFKTQLPVTASHEGAGTVVLCGSLVNTFTIGDRVMAHVKRNTCGRCDACLGPDKWKYYCRGPRDSLGITGDGAFAEYLVCDSRWSVKLPESVSFLTAAPCACAGATAFRAVKMTGLTKGQSIAIIGSGGGVGHLAVRFARHRDLRVIAIDARDEGLDASTKAGAEIVFDARSGSDAIADQVMVLTNGDGCDATINFAESSQASALACRVTKTHGTMWQVAQVSLAVPFQSSK
jgi:propanol-preferring alcohol dehydrogenase